MTTCRGYADCTADERAHGCPECLPDSPGVPDGVVCELASAQQRDDEAMRALYEALVAQKRMARRLAWAFTLVSLWLGAQALWHLWPALRAAVGGTP